MSTAYFAAARWRASVAMLRRGIFCQKIEAELLAIDGYYQTAEEIDIALLNHPAQAWLEGNVIKITATKLTERR